MCGVGKNHWGARHGPCLDFAEGVGKSDLRCALLVSPWQAQVAPAWVAGAAVQVLALLLAATVAQVVAGFTHLTRPRRLTCG